MKFDVYYKMKTRQGLIRPGVQPHPTEWSAIKAMMGIKANTDLIDQYRGGDKDAKAQLPAVCFVGECQKTRANKYMRPTQAVMLDVDHVEDPIAAFGAIKADFMTTATARDWWYDNVLLWAITPSGHGLRGVIWAQSGIPSVEIEHVMYDEHNLPCQMAYLNKHLNLSKYGDFDAPCKDFARISFFFKPDEILFENAQLLTEFSKKPDGLIINYGLDRKEQPLFEGERKETNAEAPQQVAPSEDDIPTFTEEQLQEIQSYDYDGTPLLKIIDKWVEVNGQPGKMKVHNYYNDMIKNFRNIMNNDPRVVFALLPKFGHSDAECWSQCTSICRTNTLSKLPKEFYFFLKDNGFYKGKQQSGNIAEYMLQDVQKEKLKMPWLPPVFRELLSTASDDFKLPLLDSLLPIMGTLTSCVGAKYYFGNNEYHTTSFFSVVYAPAGTGKGFVGAYMDLLFKKIKQRDYIQNARETIYLNAINKKGDNEKAPDDPHTSLRIIYPKNSESEFLGKQKDNHGYHMFTFAAEMDSWAKGVKAAGGNKNDMLRIAWDNGDYGQNFKSSSTTKGGCKLYWNVLITGTLPQVQKYFDNVENGLVTRTSFCSIDNQEFADAPKWKPMSPKQLEVVEKFVERCDRRSYREPCNLFPGDIDNVSPKKFDEEVDWRFTFLPRKTVDMEWLKPTIIAWLNKELKVAAKDYDKARDVFRRRVAVRGFRLGLICTMVWENPRTADLKKCCPFIEWFMDNDMEQMMKLWGKAYNEVAKENPNLKQKSIYNLLPDQFEKNDVMTQCMKYAITSPVAQIIYNWKKFGFIKKVGKIYYKVKKDEAKSK